MADKVFGIDVSKWQGDFDFSKAMNEGVKFAILRGAYANSKDVKFEQFYATCKSLKLPVGVYHYSMAKTVNEAINEANYLISNVLKGKQFEYPIYMDVEDATQKKLGKKLLTDIVVAYCETLENAGYYVGIYSSKSFFSTYMDEKRLEPYDKWVAQWSKDCTYGSSYGMWQFGGETNLIRSNKISGVTCDQDYALKDYPTIIKNAKLNGYNGATVPPVTTVPTAPTPSIKVGDTVAVINAINYDNGKKFVKWHSKYTVMALKGSRAVIGVKGVVTSAIDVKNLKKV